MLRESFPVFVISRRELLQAIDAGRPLSEVCRDSGTWHSQIASADRCVGFALTDFNSADSDQGRLLALMNGTLSTQLADAIQIADARFDDEYTARMVRISDSCLYFFLMTKGRLEQAMIISSPYPDADLPPLSILTARELGDKLRTLPRIVGVKFGSDNR